MSGFVGSYARKRRRNFFLFLLLILILGFFIFISPSLDIENTKIVPADNIVPDPTKDLTSVTSNIEDLELSLFQKDQKIKFRDGQIENLQIELKNLQSEYESLSIELNQIKNEYTTLLTDSEKLVSSNTFESVENKFTKINIENDKNILIIKDLNNKIKQLDKSNNSIEKNIKQISNENQKLKKDNKSLFANNLKLNESISNLENTINEQNIEIDLYLEEIKNLKDRSHHGG